MSQKRKRVPETDAEPEASTIYRSEPIDDRTSTFIGYFSPSIAPKDLQKIPEIKSASHKMLAWRKASAQRSISGSKTQYDVGHDDDGEKFGGKRVEKVLENMQVVGSCVVARWYGGVMLGPVRFAHMEECARGAIREWQEREVEDKLKRQRLEDEAVEKPKLIKALSDRDQSITVLRTLAAEKEMQVKKAIVAGVESLSTPDGDASSTEKEAIQTTSKAEETAASKPALDYAAMPIDRLRTLDKARDATLSFLLKRISKAEADMAALEDPEKPP